jgi:hypothetical protein
MEELEPPDNVVELKDYRGRLNIVPGSNLYTAEVKAIIVEHYDHYQAALTLMSWIQNGVRIACPEVILRVIPRPPPEPTPEPEQKPLTGLQGGGERTLWSRFRDFFRRKPRGV